MATTTLKKSTGEAYRPEVTYSNPDISVVFELQLGPDLIKVGDRVRLKGDTRTMYRFRCLAHNIRLDSTWVDLCSDMGFRSVRIEEVRALKVVKKRSRRHKPNGE